MSRRRLSDRTADRLVQGRDVPDEPLLTGFMAELSALAPESPPTPSYRLAALLEHGPPVLPNARVPQIGVPRPPHRLRRLSLASTAFLGLLLAAAAGNTLPNPAQQVVSDVVGWATPLDLPNPDEHEPAPAPTSPSPHPDRTPASAVPTRTRPAPAPAVSQPSAQESPAVTPSPDTTAPTDEPTDEPTEEPTDEPTDGGTPDPAPPIGLGLPPLR